MNQRRRSGGKNSKIVPIATPVVIAEIEDERIDLLNRRTIVESNLIETTLPTIQNISKAREYLTESNWSSSMQDALFDSVVKIPIRFFIIDDSGSMARDDGRIVTLDEKGFKRFTDCSRWCELAHSIRFHVELAKTGGIPCEFRLLNAGNPVRIGFSEDDLSQSHEAEYLKLMEALEEDCPRGMTPLCRHIREIIQVIKSYERILLEKRQKAMVIIATDGEASDGNLVEALRPLKDLPVGLLLRFCTNEPKVIDYWNNIDTLLELHMDVIDDFMSEANEIKTFNSWLTYGESLHRLREFGLFNFRELDKLDESLLTVEEALKVIRLLHGQAIDNLPHPHLQMNKFVAKLEELYKFDKIQKVWNPIDCKQHFWIETSSFRKCYTQSNSNCVLL